MSQLNELNRFYNEVRLKEKEKERKKKGFKFLLKKNIFKVQMDDEVNEDRIEGMETVLEEFQKTLKQIKRKMRKLSYQCQMNLNKKNSTQPHGSHHRNQCNDNGHKRINGEHWSKDACTQCVCQVGTRGGGGRIDKSIDNRNE